MKKKRNNSTSNATKVRSPGGGRGGVKIEGGVDLSMVYGIQTPADKHLFFCLL